MKGIKAAWFIGDEFVTRSFSEYFKHVKTSYTNKTFEVESFATTRYASSIREITPRLTNILANSIEKEKYLPKIIVLVLDDDFIKQLNFPNQNIKYPKLYLVLNYLVEDVHRLIANYHENLQKKARVEHFPHIIWIAPPTHKYFSNNTVRELFTEVLEGMFEENTYPNMCCLRLKKCWDEKQGGLYLPEQRRYTPEGLTQYWAGVDAAIKFWDKTLKEVLLKKQRKSAAAPYVAHKHVPTIKSVVKVPKQHRRPVQNHPHQDNRYHWRKSQHSEFGHKTNNPRFEDRRHNKRKLPTPPRCY